MSADERFLPREMKIGFAAHKRHYDRYFKSIEMVGELGNGETWLDCACGSGYGTNLLSNFSSRVVGYDISAEAIDIAKKQYATKNVSFFSELDNVSKLSMDKIFSVETIEHMPEKPAFDFLETLRGLLKPTGKMIITTPIVPETCYSPQNPYHDIEYCHQHFCSLLESTGFSIIKADFVTTTFTDGETKQQGYYLCEINK